MAHYVHAIVVTREIKHGEPIFGSATMKEYRNAGAAIRELEQAGYVVSKCDMNTFFYVDNYRMVEARIIW